MEKIFIISYYEKESNKFVDTILKAFATKDLARGYAKALENGKYKFQIIGIKLEK